MSRQESNATRLQRQVKPDGRTEHEQQKGQGRKRDRSSDVPRDAHSAVDGFTGSAAGEDALDAHRSGPVVPDVVGQGTGGRQHVERVGGELPRELGGADTARDRAAASVPQPDHLHHRRDAAGDRAKQKSGGLTAEPLVKIHQEQGRAIAEARAAEFQAWKEARAEKQKRNDSAFRIARGEWLGKIKKSVKPGNTRAKYLAVSLRFDMPTFFASSVLVSEESQWDLAERLVMGRRAVQHALSDLEATEWFQVSRRFNPKTQRYEINQYFAVGYRDIRKRKLKVKVPF
jgi:hypothetical protein